MSVSGRSYMSASLAALTAGVVALAPVTPDAATPRNLTAGIALAALVNNVVSTDEPPMPVTTFANNASFKLGNFVLAVPSYAVSQAAYLFSDAVAVAASGVAVAATYTGGAVRAEVAVAVLNGALNGAVARFNTDLTQLKTDWANTFSPAHFQNYVDGLTAPASQQAGAPPYSDDRVEVDLALQNIQRLVRSLSYAVTQAAYLTSDAVAVAASGVAVSATYTGSITSALYNALRLGSSVNTNLSASDSYDSPNAAPSVTAAVARFNTDLTRLKTDWANTFNPAHYNEYVAGLPDQLQFLITVNTPTAASLAPRPTASLASRARAASVTPRQAPSAKAAAASVKTAPTAEQSQRREARGAAHRAERSGVSATP